MQKRVITLILLLILSGVWIRQDRQDDLSRAQLAPQQVQNSSAANQATQEMLKDRDSIFAPAATLLILGLLAVLWLRFPREKRKNSSLAALLILPILAACGPAQKEVIINIEPNQTAFVVPLLGSAENQLQFQSVEFLKEKQIAAKQIVIPQRKRDLGRMPWSYEWIPSVAVIIVDRTPITREWTSTPGTGTSSSNQAFGVESSESIDFKVGATCSALVEEAMAAEFLYYFSGKSLAQVMDENVRGFIQSELFREFGSRNLEEAQAEKSEIFALMLENTQVYFEKFGITITSCGGSEGLIYSDPHIQDQINQNFAIQQEADRAAARATAQVIENEQIIAEANAYATATVVAGLAQAALLESSGQQAQINENFAVEQEVERASFRATAQAIENDRIISQANAFATATVVSGLAEAAVLENTGRQLSANPVIVDYELAQRSTGQVPGILIVNGDQVQQLPFSFFLSPDEWAEYGVDVTPAP